MYVSQSYATKNKKIMRNRINTKNILIMSHRFDDMLLKYLISCPCAPSTLESVSSMLSSILQPQDGYNKVISSKWKEPYYVIDVNKLHLEYIMGQERVDIFSPQ